MSKRDKRDILAAKLERADRRKAAHEREEHAAMLEVGIEVQRTTRAELRALKGKPCPRCGAELELGFGTMGGGGYGPYLMCLDVDRDGNFCTFFAKATSEDA